MIRQWTFLQRKLATVNQNPSMLFEQICQMIYIANFCSCSSCHIQAHSFNIFKINLQIVANVIE